MSNKQNIYNKFKNKKIYPITSSLPPINNNNNNNNNNNLSQKNSLFENIKEAFTSSFGISNANNSEIINNEKMKKIRQLDKNINLPIIN